MNINVFAVNNKISLEKKYNINVLSRLAVQEQMNNSRNELLKITKYKWIVSKIDDIVEKIKNKNNPLFIFLKLNKKISKLKDKFKNKKDILNILKYLESKIVIEIYKYYDDLDILEELINENEDNNNNNQYLKYINEWNKLYDINKFDESIIKFNNAINIKPNNSNAYNNKWLSLSAKASYKYDKVWNNQEVISLYNEAINNFNYAIKYNPNNKYAYNNKGYTLEYLWKYKEAFIAYDKAISIDPNYNNVKNNKKETIESYNKQINSNTLESKINDINIKKWLELMDFNKNKDAIIEFDKAIKNKSDLANAFYYKWLAMYYSINYSDFNKIVAVCDNVIKVNPNYTNAYRLKWKVYERYQKWGKALEEYDKAIKTDKYNAKLYLFRWYA